MLLAVAALASALGAFGLFKRSPKRAVVQQAKLSSEPVSQHAGQKRRHSESNMEEEDKTSVQADLHCSIETEKQLARAQHALKELEGAHAFVQAEKAVLAKQLAAAIGEAESARAQVEAAGGANLRQQHLEVQLGATRLQLDVARAEAQSLRNRAASLEASVSNASAEARQAHKRVRELELELPAASRAAEDLRSRLEVETKERKAAQKRSAELEVRCGALARGKARGDLDHKEAMEAALRSLAEAQERQAVAEAETQRVRSRASEVRERIEAAGAQWQKIREDLIASQQKAARLESELATERQLRGAAEREATRRARACELELRIVKESMRNQASFGSA